jgi:DNA-binding NarL/FixJ family response regulator
MQFMEKISVAIIDDQNIFRQILGLSLGSVSEFEIWGDFPDGEAFLNQLRISNLLPDVAVMDIDMPQMNGIELNTRLQQEFPLIKTIILSQHTEPKVIAGLIHAGASAYLDKGCTQKELFLAIQTVYKAGYYMNASVLKSLSQSGKPLMPDHAADGLLSSRELEVLQMICREYTNNEIADRLYLSTKTIDFHRANLLKKTNSRNVAGLVIYAVKHNLIDI